MARFSPAVVDGLIWYSASEACACVRRLHRLLILIGDSLLQHLGQALFNVVSGDYVYGGVQHEHFEENAEMLLQCSCDNAFIDRNSLDGSRTQCLLNSKVYADEAAQVSVCSTSRSSPNFFNLFEWYAPELWYDGTLDESLRALLAGRVSPEFGGRALIIISVGLHGNLDAAAMGGDVQVLV